jgi:hypothetical protein
LLRTHLYAAVAAGAVALLAGCGEDDDYENQPRPPSPIVVSASINSERVSVAPGEFGAGPITLIVTNQTEGAQELTLETDGIGKSGIRQQTGPINPGDTASLKAELEKGTYRVAVNGAGIKEAALDVGDPRESAQNELLQP